MKDTIAEVEERFDKHIPREVGIDTDFGYKIYVEEDGIKNIFTITDWQKIRNFLKKELELCRSQVLDEAIELLEKVKDDEFDAVSMPVLREVLLSLKGMKSK